MINIHILEHPLISSVGYWRIFMPLKAMDILYPGAFSFSCGKKDLNYFDTWNSDVIICPRPGDLPDVNEFLEAAKMSGAKIIVDVDDDILQLPEFHDLYHDYKPGSERHKRAVKTIELADFFWFSVPKFLETYSKNGIVALNAIFPEWLPDEPAPDRGLWAWRGRSIQSHDLVLAGREWYGEINHLAKQWMFLGWMPPLEHGDNVASAPFLDNPQKYISLIRASGFNGIWKPMVECPFNDHKSNISWIEATLSGGVCLTNYAGRPEWEFATDKFPTYKEACKLWERSKEHITTHYNLLAAAQARAESIFRLCSHLLPISPATATT